MHIARMTSHTTRHIFSMTILILILSQSGISCAAPIQQEQNETKHISGKIIHSAFQRSVPGVTKVGEHYIVLVQIENAGSDAADFNVILFYNWRYLFFDEPSKTITLGGGEKRILRFDMVPYDEHTGPLQITAKLFVQPNGDNATELDATSDSVTEIMRRDSSCILFCIASALFIIIVLIGRLTKG